MTADFMLDTSATARGHIPAVAERLQPLISRGLAAGCPPLELEHLYSSRNAADYERRRDNWAHTFAYLPTTDREFSRALQVQRILARTGRHRSVRMPDLLIAATAERHGVTLIHYDNDFEVIASVTGQSCAWVVPRGSVT